MIEPVAKLFDRLYCIIPGFIPEVCPLQGTAALLPAIGERLVPRTVSRPAVEVVHLNAYEQRHCLTLYFVGGAVSEI